MSAEQLDLLGYVEPTRLRASARDATLVVRATGPDREAQIDAVVGCINDLDRVGFPALAMYSSGALWPYEVAGRIEWRMPARTARDAAAAAEHADAWWSARGGA